MKVTGALAAIIMAGTAHAFGPSQCGPHRLTVYVSGEEVIPRHIVTAAQRTAALMLREAGVQVSWKAGDHHSRMPPEQTQAEHHMFVRFADDSRGSRKNALASADSYDGLEITVYSSRLQWGSQQPELFTGLLAHILVHEIAHNLQGVSWHAQTGIMKAGWSTEDLSQMALVRLHFEPADRILIRSGIEKWQSLHSPQACRVVPDSIPILGEPGPMAASIRSGDGSR